MEDKWREQKAAAEESAEQEVDEQGKPLTKKQRQQVKRAADKERAKQRQATQDRMEPQVILLSSCHITTTVTVAVTAGVTITVVIILLLSIIGLLQRKFLCIILVCSIAAPLL